MNIYTRSIAHAGRLITTRHPDGGVRQRLQLNEGLDRRSAIEMAARIRLRPILMTTRRPDVTA